MRRKTIAKRIFDLEYEEEEEEDPKYEDFDITTSHSQPLCHRLQKRRKHTHPVKENGEENPPCNTALQKLKTRGLGGLQSRSKADLVAMVLSMQSEMDSLREQIRCLTACGKLARNLEALIERTEVWSSSTDRRTTSPSMPEILVRSGAMTTSALLASPGVLNGCWSAKLEPPHPHPNGHPPGSHEGGSQINGPPLYQEFITAELLDRCNTGTTAQKLTNDLLRGLYERDCLASHSISGIVNNKRGQPKPALPADEIQAILRVVQHYFPGKTDSEIKGYIRQKLQNEAKRLRKKPNLALKAEPEAGSEGAETTFYT
ncbi:uncharacterized protein LOC121569679 isoform X2 [Coregonus clupeaformis]|uniref:uncharacterized protein LOC121569679 isoform X2 n=1 Tax=Coregonus clupeaformis TaxID=59861 RepID=UPI001BDF738C|nr:uncharacterized protein LOC121569679 isoform X2 [Coregonus clupeaformis]